MAQQGAPSETPPQNRPRRPWRHWFVLKTRDLGTEVAAFRSLPPAVQNYKTVFVLQASCLSVEACPLLRAMPCTLLTQAQNVRLQVRGQQCRVSITKDSSASLGIRIKVANHGGEAWASLPKASSLESHDPGVIRQASVVGSPLCQA